MRYLNSKIPSLRYKLNQACHKNPNKVRLNNFYFRIYRDSYLLIYSNELY